MNRFILGDALTELKNLPDESVHCCVTSPPYWALRDYGVEGQLGLESTPDQYVARMVEVFREVRRVLRGDGTLWVNVGDTYLSMGGSGWQGKNGQRENRRHTQRSLQSRSARATRDMNCGIKPKDLVGIPWMLALALRADGWYLRSDIIWHKPNPMPQSVTDRPTTAHEYIFLLTKKANYYYDAASIKESCSPNTHARMAREKPTNQGSARANGGTRATRPMRPVVSGSRKLGTRSDGVKANADFAQAMAGHVTHRNKRTVWTVGSKPFKGAHFATFPPKLIEPCVRAGCPPEGIVLDPFLGAGTTAYVAKALNRRFIGIELNPEYLELAKRRVGE